MKLRAAYETRVVTWWTVHFDAPANKRLSCHREEIVKMKADA
jgi:hypothetical protein